MTEGLAAIGLMVLVLAGTFGTVGLIAWIYSVWLEY